MSGVPSAREIHLGAVAIRKAMEVQQRDPDGEPAFWTNGPRASWQRLVPDAAAVRAGDPDAVEHAIVFLEADPWCFRSGYEKELLLRALGTPDLSAGQQTRLDEVVLRLARTGRRELTAALSLVRRRRGPGLKPALRLLLHDPDDAVAARTLRLLLAARRPRLDEAGRARALAIVRRGAVRMSDGERRRVVEAALGPAPTWRSDDTTT